MIKAKTPSCKEFCHTWNIVVPLSVYTCKNSNKFRIPFASFVYAQDDNTNSKLLTSLPAGRQVMTNDYFSNLIHLTNLPNLINLTNNLQTLPKPLNLSAP